MEPNSYILSCIFNISVLIWKTGIPCQVYSQFVLNIQKVCPTPLWLCHVFVCCVVSSLLVSSVSLLPLLCPSHNSCRNLKRSLVNSSFWRTLEPSETEEKKINIRQDRVMWISQKQHYKVKSTHSSRKTQAGQNHVGRICSV